MTNKFCELSLFLASSTYDLVAISETWLDDNVADAEFTSDNYVCFRQDRNLTFYDQGVYSRSDRGGVVFLVRKALSPTLCNITRDYAEIL